MKNIVVYYFILSSLSSCTGQSKDIDSCKLSYKKARRDVSSYYENNNESLLEKALYDVEPSLECKQTRLAAVELKLSLLSQLKQYKKGYEFTDSVKENDFKFSYKKGMWYNYLHGMESKSKGDTTTGNKYLHEIITNIQNFINHENINKDTVNEEAYYDLFFIKTYVLKEQTKAELNELEERYPNEKDFFETLKTTYQPQIKGVQSKSN